MNKFSPWVEKYRPSSLRDVVLDVTNKQILNNILDKNYFPNLLFFITFSISLNSSDISLR